MITIRRAYDLCFFDDILRRGDTYVEIGAHHGRFLIESGLFSPDKVFHLYEPSPTACKALRRRFSDADNVYIHRCAVASVRGHRDFFVDDGHHHGVGNTLYANVLPKAEKTMVQVITLADIFSENAISHIRLLALNAELAEYEILADEPRALERVDYITCEFHPGKSGIDTAHFLVQNLPNFQTLTICRRGEPYNIWFGKHHQVTV